MATSIAASRFALLKIEGSDDEEPQKQTGKSKNGTSKAAQKKKGKKKQNNDASDLRSLAFGGGGKSSTGSRSANQKSDVVPQKQYDSWAEHDKEQVDSIFQHELQQAILMSKVESEKQAAVTVDTSNQSEDQSVAQAAGKKKSKNKAKSKQKAMSIDEFQHGAAQPEQKEEHYLDRRKISGSGDDFFNDVATNAAHIVKQDKLQEEYKKQYKVQAVLQAKHTTELEIRDKTIEELRAELLESQEELKRVKKRNKQLCFILGQGEMKEKAEILQQVDSLTQIKDELTLQVTDLTSELEKERSKVHSLQNELSRSKHKPK